MERFLDHFLRVPFLTQVDVKHLQRAYRCHCIQELLDGLAADYVALGKRAEAHSAGLFCNLLDLPRKVLGLLGILDDAGVVAWLYSKVGSKITPDIELKADMKLDEWFGPEIVRGIIFD